MQNDREHIFGIGDCVAGRRTRRRAQLCDMVLVSFLCLAAAIPACAEPNNLKDTSAIVVGLQSRREGSNALLGEASSGAGQLDRAAQQKATEVRRLESQTYWAVHPTGALSRNS